MQNDENQEDVTLENDIKEETTEEEAEVVEEVEEKDWEKEAKKWEAIAKRKAKKAETAEPVTPQALDADLIDITYRNYLAAAGLTSKSVQDEAMALAKKMQIPVSSIQADESIMEVLRAKQANATTNQATAKGTGGAGVKPRGAEYYASQIKSGRGIDKSNLQRGMAAEILKQMN